QHELLRRHEGEERARPEAHRAVAGDGALQIERNLVAHLAAVARSDPGLLHASPPFPARFRAAAGGSRSAARRQRPGGGTIRSIASRSSAPSFQVAAAALARTFSGEVA